MGDKKISNKMHYYQMTITEDIESEYRSELKLWPNTDGNIWIQIGYDESDPYATQGMAISADDARALIRELNRLISGFTQNPDANQPTINQRSSEGEMMRTNQETTNNQPGQQLTLEKVNWGGK